MNRKYLHCKIPFLVSEKAYGSYLSTSTQEVKQFRCKLHVRHVGRSSQKRAEIKTAKLMDKLIDTRANSQGLSKEIWKLLDYLELWIFMYSGRFQIQAKKDLNLVQGIQMTLRNLKQTTQQEMSSDCKNSDDQPRTSHASRDRCKANYSIIRKRKRRCQIENYRLAIASYSRENKLGAKTESNYSFLTEELIEQRLLTVLVPVSCILQHSPRL